MHRLDTHKTGRHEARNYIQMCNGKEKEKGYHSDRTLHASNAKDEQ